MSGIEVIGLALAFWPVVGAMKELYDVTKGGTGKSLALTIQVQERIFKECVLKLLQSDEDLSEKDRAGLANGEKSFESLWKDAEFSSRLESRLDPEMCILIKHQVGQISKMVASLQKLVGPSKTEGPKKSGSTIMTGVKRVLRKDEIKKGITSLAQYNDSLRRLLESCSNTAYADAKPSTARTHHRRQSQEVRRRGENTQFYNGFHEVLGKSFRCNCSRGHQANLSVSDTFVMFQAEELTRAMSSFRLRERSDTIESDVTAVGSPTCSPDEEEDDMSELIRSTWSPARNGSQAAQPCEQAALLVKYSEIRGVQNFTPIPDLCQWIHTVRMSPPNSPGISELNGVLGNDSNRYTVRAPRQNVPMSIVPMDQWLTSCGTERKKRRVRAELAMNLASTILQFYPTPWIESSWTWRNFSVAQDDSSHHLVITQRFWSMDMPRHSLTPAPSRFWQTFSDLDPMLVRLGFALIELALGRRLSDIRTDNERGDETDVVVDDGRQDMDLADYSTAMAILQSNEIRDEIGNAYQCVVDACLRCRVLSDDGLMVLKSDLGRFESDLEQFVVEPLRDYHSTIWGNMPVATF
ncbi:hypothetical protein CMQ_6622 [Grosmannia clavigera kw1407]|uniref:DUF7580 domain-containing protein n=1 Tax=Grosmannia clavigera (strain kw1407 / UAMH 11150) TaxID=655863 RepID=F0X6X8_GROCL|nr:uncharacterized protein CMQ_6622 [Grosmannia clavigera kw1407]EFX06301.1 hypothetical protein CMQ_6622 [Grosmannia clavigera kw1407]